MILFAHARLAVEIRNTCPTQLLSHVCEKISTQCIVISFVNRNMDENKNLSEKLAESVRIYKCIYDKACPEFKNKVKTGKCWLNVATKLNLKSGKQVYLLYFLLRIIIFIYYIRGKK